MASGGEEPGHRRARPGGPLVAVCAGHRCVALREQTGAAEALRSAVRQTPGAVLVAADCLGPCHLAAVALVAHRDPETDSCGPGLWLTGIDNPERASALRQWVLERGPAGPDASPLLPRALAEAVVVPPDQPARQSR